MTKDSTVLDGGESLLPLGCKAKVVLWRGCLGETWAEGHSLPGLTQLGGYQAFGCLLLWNDNHILCSQFCGSLVLAGRSRDGLFLLHKILDPRLGWFEQLEMSETAPQGSYISGASVRLLAGFFGSSSPAICWDCSVLQGVVFTHISASEGWNSLGTASIALSTLSSYASFQQGSLRVVDLLLTRQLRTLRVSAPRKWSSGVCKSACDDLVSEASKCHFYCIQLFKKVT